MRIDERRNDVPPEIVSTFGVRCVCNQAIEQEICIEDIDPHRTQAARRVIGHRFGILRLFLELDNTTIAVNLHDPELRSLFQRTGKTGHSCHRPRADVVPDQFGVIHLVDMVATQNQQVFRLAFFDRINVLVDSISRSLVPVLVKALLRGQDVDEFVELATQESPAEIHMSVKTDGLVLRQNQDLSQSAVDAIRQRKIDDTIGTAEWYRRFGPVSRQWFQTRPFTSGQYQCQYCSHHLYSFRSCGHSWLSSSSSCFQAINPQSTSRAPAVFHVLLALRLQRGNWNALAMFRIPPTDAVRGSANIRCIRWPIRS